jgi:hypothetical protein
VGANQALADDGAAFLQPRTPEELAARNRALFASRSAGESELIGAASRQVHSALTLPDYAHAMKN